jgi:hypothetical protein
MRLAESGHEFEVLPVIAVHDRWRTYVTLDVKRELPAAADLLKSILHISKFSRRS